MNIFLPYRKEARGIAEFFLIMKLKIGLITLDRKSYLAFIDISNKVINRKKIKIHKKR